METGSVYAAMAYRRRKFPSLYSSAAHQPVHTGLLSSILIAITREGWPG